jgi:hypothetical protein
MTVGIGFIMAFPLIALGLCLQPYFHMLVEFEHFGFPYCFQVVHSQQLAPIAGYFRKILLPA